MRNRFIAGMTLLSFIAGTGLPVLALTPATAKGAVESSTGQVLHRAGDQSWQKLDGQTLAAGDVIRTGQDGQAIISFGNSRVRLSANTDLRVDSVGQGKTELTLERGNVLSKAGDKLTVSTARTKTTASEGQFALQTSDKAAALKVISGNARLAAIDASEVQTPALNQIPDKADQKMLAALDNVSNVQTNGEVALYGEWQSKGKGPRIRNTNESVGGEEDAAPDQDFAPAEQPAPAPQPAPPAPAPAPAPPVVTTPPPAPVAPAAVAGGTSILPFVAGGLLLAAGGIIIANNSDDDEENPFIPDNPGVPSPSLP